MATGTLKKNMVLLWTNPNPTSSFTPQTVQVDLTNYRFVLISYENKAGSDPRLIHFVHEKGAKSIVSSIYSYKIINRTIDVITDSGVDFAGGGISDTYATITADNSYFVPYQIFGIV